MQWIRYANPCAQRARPARPRGWQKAAAPCPRFPGATVLFQLGPVPESVAHLFPQLPIGAVDGVKDDGLQFFRIDHVVCPQHGFVCAYVDDLPHHPAGFRVIAYQPAFHRHGQLLDQGRVHKFRPGGMPTRLLQLIGRLVAGFHPHIVAGCHLFCGSHAHGKGLAGQDVGGGLVPGADAAGTVF